MSIQDLLEEGDTGEALLPAKVNDQGVHADRDGSERPALPAPPVHIVHNHDLDPTCRETRNQHDRLVGECLKAPRAETPSTDDARTRGAESRVPHRLEILRDMTDRERRLALAFIAGFSPETFDAAMERRAERLAES